MIDKLSQHWNTLQATLFPLLKKEVGTLTDKQLQLATAIEFARIEEMIPHLWRPVGRPPHNRAAIACAFLAKAIYNLPSTRDLLDRLNCDPVLRRLCGWESKRSVPSEATFSRAFAEFAEMNLLERIHEVVVIKYHSNRLIAHISRDATAINTREKVPKKPKALVQAKKKRPPPSDRLQRQVNMSLEEMLADLPRAANMGKKVNSKGFPEKWKGYSLHIDTADGDIPISAILTSASLHDSQVAIPLTLLTQKRVTHCYSLMDSAYDAKIIREFTTACGNVPLIDFNHRGPADRRAFAPHEAQRFKERSASERLNSNLKDNYGGRFVRVRGNEKVYTHLMFSLLAITIAQTLRLLI